MIKRGGCLLITKQVSLKLKTEKKHVNSASASSRKFSSGPQAGGASLKKRELSSVGAQ